jgi:riboflavin kinase/FMN adenylyltransferase
MNVLYGYDHVPLNARGSVLAIGNFDGVHRGHQALLDRVVAQAAELRAVPAVMIFEPHPREFFHPEEPHFRLTPLNEKLRLLERLGIKVAVVLPFNAQLAAMTAGEFIERVLVAGLGVRHVVIGYDFFFGNRRAGTPETMRLAGAELGFGVSVIAPVAEGGEVFSSTSIRLKLAQGDVRGAARELGHWWRVCGEVVGGARRGTGLGFPTANVPLPPGTALAHGIYAARAFVGGAWHEAAAYLGTRPTFDNGKPVLEVFLFDFDGELYGRTMDVEFIDFIRPDRRFETSEALQRQMREDCDKSRAILAALPSPRL